MTAFVFFKGNEDDYFYQLDSKAEAPVCWRMAWSAEASRINDKGGIQ